jgi:hypothetical protein
VCGDYQSLWDAGCGCSVAVVVCLALNRRDSEERRRQIWAERAIAEPKIVQVMQMTKEIEGDCVVFTHTKRAGLSRASTLSASPSTLGTIHPRLSLKGRHLNCENALEADSTREIAALNDAEAVPMVGGEAFQPLKRAICTKDLKKPFLASTPTPRASQGIKSISLIIEKRASGSRKYL